MAGLHLVLPGYRYWSFPWNLVGVVPLFLGVFLNLTADRVFTGCHTTVKPFESSSVLVTEFPFSVSRNPMYLGLTAMLLGVALLLGTVSALLPVLIFPSVMHLAFVRTEERMLSETFGAAWQDYRSRVRRWL